MYLEILHHVHLQKIRQYQLNDFRKTVSYFGKPCIKPVELLNVVFVSVYSLEDEKEDKAWTAGQESRFSH